MPRGTQSPGVPDTFARNVYLALDDFWGRSIIDATVTGAVAIDKATMDIGPEWLERSRIKSS